MLAVLAVLRRAPVPFPLRGLLSPPVNETPPDNLGDVSPRPLSIKTSSRLAQARRCGRLPHALAPWFGKWFKLLGART